MADHSSIEPNPLLTQYTGSDCKYYYLPIFPESPVPSRLKNILGLCNHEKRSEQEVDTSILKAQTAHYSHIKVPVDRSLNTEYSDIFDKIKKSRLNITLQIIVSQLQDDLFFEQLKALPDHFEMEWVLDQRTHLLEQRIFEVSETKKQTHLSVPVFRQTDWTLLFSEKLIENFQNWHLYFGYHCKLDDDYLNCHQIQSLLSRLRSILPSISFLPPKGVDLWDHRAQSDFDMEPVREPCYKTQSHSPNIQYSVIIPSFNNQNHLRVVLRHLYVQNIGLDQFEIIIVDDGSTDQTQQLVLELLNSFPEPMNFKYIFFHRERPRVMGDSQYRAGISRNLGVKNAEGEILCFLDSDIVVPGDYLQKVGEALQKWDALQAKRINLSQAKSHLDIHYEQIVEKTDCIADEKYWKQFLETKAWHKMPYNWKYVCTHSFSIKKDLFWQIGGLKRNFIYYGFEDTDLGYRLVKRGYNLHLLNIKVFHLFHENTRSEFLNLSSLRHSLLSRTAQIFYLHHLDEDIYKNLRGYMEPEPTFERLLKGTLKNMTLPFLWQRKPEVYRSLRRIEREQNNGYP